MYGITNYFLPDSYYFKSVFKNQKLSEGMEAASEKGK